MNLLYLLFFILLLPASSFAEMVESHGENYILEYSFESTPIKKGSSELSFQIRDFSDRPVENISNIQTRNHMPSMNHGGGRPIQTKEDGRSKFYTDGNYFSMPGIWEVIVTIQVDGATDYFKIPVRVVR